MKKLIIIGAGGGGRETCAWAKRRYEGSELSLWRPHGYLDRNPDALSGKTYTLPILGCPDTWAPAADEVFVCSIGNPAVRLSICESLAARGAEFVNVADPTVIFAEPLRNVGRGVVIYPGSMIGPDTTIEPHAYLNMNTVLGHDARVGAGTVISPNVNILGGVKIGCGVFIGSCVTIFPGVTIGDRAIVGAGSLVTKDVGSGVKVYGSPAKSR